MAGIHRSSSASSKTGLPPQELLDDLCSRFVLNVPKEDLQSFERILFLVEQAHWFYEDNSVEQNPSLKSLSLREFTSLMLAGERLESWCKLEFPRGKKKKDEEDHACAIREVLEETGFDISKLLKLEDNIEVVIGQQRVRLYIIAGVKEDTVFAPQTKKEISEISWHRLVELQPAGNDVISRGSSGLKLFMVASFLMPLKAWISAHYPTTQKSDISGKGATCWKAKAGSTGSMSDAIPSRTGIDGHANAPLTVISPGKIFRSFRFDSALIVRALEAAFASS